MIYTLSEVFYFYDFEKRVTLASRRQIFGTCRHIFKPIKPGLCRVKWDEWESSNWKEVVMVRQVGILSHGPILPQSRNFARKIYEGHRKHQ